jgi:hypothetical protein
MVIKKVETKKITLQLKTNATIKLNQKKNIIYTLVLIISIPTPKEKQNLKKFKQMIIICKLILEFGTRIQI